MFSVDPKIVKAVANCASSDPKRYALTAIKTECLGGGLARFTATDGKQLVRVEFKHFDPIDFPSEIDALKRAPNTAKSALIPAAEFAKTVSKAKVSKRGVPILTMPVVILGESESTIVGTDLASRSVDAIRNEEGSFPNCDKDGGIWPEGEPIATVKLNPTLLAKLCAVALSLNPDARHPVMEISIFAEKVTIEKSMDRDGKNVNVKTKSPQPVRIVRIVAHRRGGNAGAADMDAMICPIQE